MKFDGGVGVVMGVGVIEVIFGVEIGNVLMNFIIKLFIVFFVFSFGFYLG